MVVGVGDGGWCWWDDDAAAASSAPPPCSGTGAEEEAESLWAAAVEEALTLTLRLVAHGCWRRAARGAWVKGDGGSSCRRRAKSRPATTKFIPCIYLWWSVAKDMVSLGEPEEGKTGREMNASLGRRDAPDVLVEGEAGLEHVGQEVLPRPGRVAEERLQGERAADVPQDLALLLMEWIGLMRCLVSNSSMAT